MFLCLPKAVTALFAAAPEGLAIGATAGLCLALGRSVFSKAYMIGLACKIVVPAMIFGCALILLHRLAHDMRRHGQRQPCKI